MGIIKLVILGVVGLVVLLGGIGGIYYATDGAVDATVTDKQCGFNGGTVTVVTEFPIPGIEHTLQDVPSNQCSVINKGNFVRYHLQSERTSIWQSEGGACVYDTEYGVGGCSGGE